jgi:hypothetical protein
MEEGRSKTQQGGYSQNFLRRILKNLRNINMDIRAN